MITEDPLPLTVPPGALERELRCIAEIASGIGGNALAEAEEIARSCPTIDVTTLRLVDLVEATAHCISDLARRVRDVQA